MKLYPCNDVIHNGPLVCDTAPQGIWFSANTYGKKLITQTIYPITQKSENVNGAPSLKIGIEKLLCGPRRWVLYMGRHISQ